MVTVTFDLELLRVEKEMVLDIKVKSFVAQTEKAFCIKAYVSSGIITNVWLPKSQCQMTILNGGFNLRFTIPGWLVKNKGLDRKSLPT